MFKHISTAACAVLLIGLIAGQSARADKTETFDSAASAAAHGWVAGGSTSLDDGGVAGWADTNYAGGAAAGEAKYDVNRGTDLSYLDTNLGLTINGNGGFSMTGTFSLVASETLTTEENPYPIYGDADTGIPPILGFSSSDTEYVGIMFRSDDSPDLSWGLRLESATAGGIQFNAGGDFSRVMAVGQPHTFSLIYDPGTGGEGDFGSISASVSDAGGMIVRFLTGGERDLLNYTRAGIFKRLSNEGNSGFNLRLDDITYTGVAPTVDVLPGDYNNDQVVNAADYTVWRDNLGAGDESSLNGNGDGMNGVDAGDYSRWKDHFGDISAGTGGIAGGSPVPEPASWLLATLVGVAIGSLGRCSR